MNILIKEKANVARLRDLYEKEQDPLIKESIRFRLAEARLWHDVAESGVLSPERIEQVKPKARKRAKIVVIGISIAVVLAIVLSGCRSTILGTGQILQGIGTGTGTVITGVGDYLVEEGQE